MANDYGVIEDTQTGLCCTQYSTTLANCQWGNEDDAVQFISVGTAETTAADMNAQAPAVARFIGRRPRGH